MNSKAEVLKRQLKPMKICCKIALIWFAVYALSGCVAGMALDANSKHLANLKQPIGIFTLRMENAYKPSYQPDVHMITIESIGSYGKKVFGLENPYKQGENQYNEYLVSVPLEPGNYLLGEVNGYSTSFFLSGHFRFPANARFNLENGITYLGNVTMTNREHKEGEQRSGGRLPLLDQALTGFYGGTFDVTVTDSSATDIPDFIQACPALKDVNITKAIMQK